MSQPYRILGSVGRHTPRILRKQLISQLCEQYSASVIDYKQSSKTINGKTCESPSIERFDGALLFIDISGFTKLSQQLNVEDLKNQINDYFTKMLDVVEKHGGDVIKFAGDALYIAWCKSSFEKSSRGVILLGVACGVEIISTCSNQKIDFNKTTSGDKSPHNRFMRQILPSLNALFGQTTPPAVNTATEQDKIDSASSVFLNVHAGISVGQMAGVDIGVGDRWEYLLVGEPLSRVAIAESLAAIGELVVCPDTHTLFYSKENAVHSPTSIASVVDDDSATCSCIRLHNGYYQICKPALSQIATPTKMSRTAIKLRQSLALDETFVLDTKLVDTIEMDIKSAYDLMLSSIVADNTAELGNASRKSIKHQCLSWMSACLSVDLAHHTHHVMRSGMMSLSNTIKRVDMFADHCMLESLNAHAASVVPFPDEVDARHEHTQQRPVLSPIVRPKSLPTSPGANRNSSLRRFSSSKLLDIHDSDALSTAEIRSVAVLFIKIDVKNMSLFVDEQIQVPVTDVVNKSDIFCQRTAPEVVADRALLAQLQSSFVCIASTLDEFGGQMRQFIVDDKGTVCIATFGLRGSVSNDNAAAAVDTAHNIVKGLAQIGLSSSVGVTLGEAFCGLVGSSKRHEYAVMGPSVNLSARLMCKARGGKILCDGKIRHMDRSHKFLRMEDVTAKGFPLPLETYTPVVDLDSVLVPVTSSRGGSVRAGSNRLTEDICHRFDQLSSQEQALLKIASAACYNEHSFSLELLQFVTSERPTKGYSFTVEPVANILCDILLSGEFLTVSNVDVKVWSREDVLSGQLSFSFVVPIEVTTIYSLLLEGHKQVFHEAIADFYLYRGEQLSDSTWAVEAAFHCHMAGCLCESMRCYYHASQSKGCAHEAEGLLAQAHILMQELLCDFPAPHHEDWSHSRELVLCELHTAMDSILDPSSEINIAEWSESQPRRVSLSDLHHVFQGDSDILSAAVSILLHVLKSDLQAAAAKDDDDRWMSIHAQIELLLEIFTLLKHPVMFSTCYVANLLNNKQHASAAANNSEYFVLPEFSSQAQTLLSICDAHIL